MTVLSTSAADIVSQTGLTLSWPQAVVFLLGGGGLFKLAQLWAARRVTAADADRTSADADMTDAQSDGVRMTQSLGLYQFVRNEIEREVSRQVAPLQAEVEQLREQLAEDDRVRHRLKGALAYVVAIAQQAIAAIAENWTDDEIDGLPQPLRDHVRGHLDFKDHLDMTRPRTT